MTALRHLAYLIRSRNALLTNSTQRALFVWCLIAPRGPLSQATAGRGHPQNRSPDGSQYGRTYFVEIDRPISFRCAGRRRAVRSCSAQLGRVRGRGNRATRCAEHFDQAAQCAGAGAIHSRSAQAHEVAQDQRSVQRAARGRERGRELAQGAARAQPHRSSKGAPRRRAPGRRVTRALLAQCASDDYLVGGCAPVGARV